MKFFLFFIHYKPSKNSKISYAFIVLEANEYNERMEENIRRIVNRFTYFTEGCVLHIELIDNTLKEKIYSDSLQNLQLLEPYFEGMKHLIYYNKQNNLWRIHNTIEPDLSILNYLENNKILKLYVIDNKFLNNYGKERLENIMSVYFHVKEVDISFMSYNVGSIKNLRDIVDNTNNEYAVILPENTEFRKLIEINKGIKYSSRFHIYQVSDKDIYEMKNTDGLITYERLLLPK